jgi:hypothetical protein
MHLAEKILLPQPLTFGGDYPPHCTPNKAAAFSEPRSVIKTRAKTGIDTLLPVIFRCPAFRFLMLAATSVDGLISRCASALKSAPMRHLLFYERTQKENQISCVRSEPPSAVQKELQFIAVLMSAIVIDPMPPRASSECTVSALLAGEFGWLQRTPSAYVLRLSGGGKLPCMPPAMLLTLE